MEVATMAEVQPAHPRASGVIGMGGNGGSDSAHFYRVYGCEFFYRRGILLDFVFCRFLGVERKREM